MDQDKNIKKETLLCQHCETGKQDFALDRTSLFCSYIACLHDGKCSIYIPFGRRIMQYER